MSIHLRSPVKYLQQSLEIKNMRNSRRMRGTLTDLRSQNNGLQLADFDHIRPGSDRKSIPMDRRSHMSFGSVFSHNEAMKLNNFEVYITMLKFLIATGIFNRLFLYKQYGVTNAFAADIISIFIVIFSYFSLITCIYMMPKDLTSPSSNLTYGKVVGYVLDFYLDERNERI